LSPACEARSSIPGQTILLVEDEAFVREVAGEVLRSAGHRVLVASNAAGGIAAFRIHAENVRLLLTDVVLPDRSGYDLARDIAATLGSWRTIFISGYPENTRLHTGPGHKRAFYLAKPFSAEALVKTVAEALQAATG
jgi:CheY-like chemotaxis protein